MSPEWLLWLALRVGERAAENFLWRLLGSLAWGLVDSFDRWGRWVPWVVGGLWVVGTILLWPILSFLGVLVSALLGVLLLVGLAAWRERVSGPTVPVILEAETERQHADNGEPHWIRLFARVTNPRRPRNFRVQIVDARNLTAAPALPRGLRWSDGTESRFLGNDQSELVEIGRVFSDPARNVDGQGMGGSTSFEIEGRRVWSPYDRPVRDVCFLELRVFAEGVDQGVFWFRLSETPRGRLWSAVRFDLVDASDIE